MTPTPTPPVPVDLVELERLAKAATDGPWYRDRLEPETVRTEPEGDIVIYETQHIRDAAFIAAANPATILAMIERDRALTARIAELDAIIRVLDDHLGEDDGMWSDDSTVSTEWIGSDGVRRSLTFGLLRRARATRKGGV